MLEAGDQGLVQQIIRIRSLKDSNEAVLQGLASGDVVLVDGMVIAQAKIASSVPLGETIPRLAAPSDQVRQLRPTRKPEIELSGIAARHLRVTNRREYTEATTICHLIVNEVERPAGVDRRRPGSVRQCRQLAAWYGACGPSAPSSR